VNRVLLSLTARDDEGRLVTDLGRDDLRILEDGKLQEIVDFEVERRPINLAILIDTSQSTRGTLPDVQEAVASFVDTMRPDDQALVIDFSDEAYLIEELTSDRQALAAAVRSTEAIGGTALFEALHAAYRELDEIDGRKAIVLVSHGGVYGDKRDFASVADRARSSNLMIFAVGLTDGSEGPAPDRKVLGDLAKMTGGRFWLVKKAEHLGEVYRTIADELAHQYFVTYSSPIEEWDGRWVPIEVEARRPGVEVRARTGYVAVRGALGDGG
jgi:VWFA-related protein